MWKKILLGLLLVIVVLVIVVAVQPGELTITRSIAIAAPPDAVFPHVNDFHAWQDWSPWAKMDPNAKNSFDGPAAGKDAKFKWSGNNDVGEGTMTILDSVPNEKVHIQLDFVRPMACTNLVDFTFKPDKDQTLVTWTMAGQKNFIAKGMGLVMDMDKMVGGEFEKGLASLKAVVEKPDSK